MMESTYIIETHKLGKNYKNLTALQSLNLRVPQNSIFGFLGPNGAGKTTTIKLMLGLIRPTAGSASIFGMDTVRQSVEIRESIGYLPQEPRFFEYMTARELLHFVARFFFKRSSRVNHERVEEMLELVDLTGKANRPIGTFSVGERQRLGLAQAQINSPDLLILDEPAASLDPLGRRDVLEVMSKLRKHTTVFYSTHILDDVQRVSDSVAILNRGQLVAQGPIENLLDGGHGTVYSIHLRGQVEAARLQVLSQPWVTGIFDGQQNGNHSWEVSVSDPQQAEAQLFRLLAGCPIEVTEFRRKKYQLEDIFMRVVEGGRNDRNQHI